MAAFLRKIFKPRRPEKETQPRPLDLEQLDPRAERDREALFQLIINPQTSERELVAALTKTASLEIILPWYVESPPRVQALIADWIARQPGSERRLAQARSRLQDPRLQRVIDQLGATSPVAADAPRDLSSQGPEQLERLALRARTAAERRQAAEQLDDEATLQRVARAARGRDKTVYQIARQKLQALREEASRHEALRLQRTKLIDELEQHARTEVTQQYQARFDSLVARWGELQASATEDEQHRFHSAQAQCQVRCNELAAAAREQARQQAQADQRHETLTLLQETLEQLRQGGAGQIPGSSSLDAVQKTQENRWLEATRDSEVSRAEQKRYEQLMQELRHYLQAVQTYESRRTELEQQLTEEDGERLTEVLDAIAWPPGFAEPELLQNARRKRLSSPAPAAASAAPGPEAAGKLESLLERLEQELENKALKPSRRLLREAQQAADRLPEKLRRAHLGRLTLLARQVQDLQDWQGFATRPKQEALCQQMEHLAQQHMEPEIKAAKIHELQTQWRELGGSSDQHLWQRFRQAADLAFEPCQDYFAARNQLKEANLHKREQICDELSMFVTQVDWSTCDWRGVEKIHRKAREEWRNAKPIDFRRNRDVQRRFDALLKEMDVRLNQERDRNEAAKADIVNRAQALADHEPLAEAISQAKDLQREWQTVGITRQRRDRALWQSFRAACDRIFARRDDQRAQQQAQQSEQQAAAEAILERISQQLALEPSGQDRQAINADLQAFRHLELPARQREPLNRRFRELQARVEQSARQADLAQQKRQWLDQLKATSADGTDPAALRELCVRAEILAGIESPPEDQKQRMTLQVERLAAGMGQGQNFPDTRAEMDHLVRLWQDQAGPSPEPQLAGRMEQAIHALQA